MNRLMTQADFRKWLETRWQQLLAYERAQEKAESIALLRRIYGGGRRR